MLVGSVICRNRSVSSGLFRLEVRLFNPLLSILDFVPTRRIHLSICLRQWCFYRKMSRLIDLVVAQGNDNERAGPGVDNECSQPSSARFWSLKFIIGAGRDTSAPTVPATPTTVVIVRFSLRPRVMGASLLPGQPRPIPSQTSAYDVPLASRVE